MNEGWKSRCANDGCGVRDERTACECGGEGTGGSILCADSTAANA